MGMAQSQHGAVTCLHDSSVFRANVRLLWPNFHDVPPQSLNEIWLPELENIDWWGVVTRYLMHWRSLFQILPLLYNTVLVLRCYNSIFWNAIEFGSSQAFFSVWPLEFACLCESTWQFKYFSLFSFSILALPACFRMTVAWLQFPFLATPQSRTPVWGRDRI